MSRPAILAATVVGASLLAPFALGFGSDHAAVAEHIAFAMALGPIALLIAELPSAALATAAGGVWLMAAPWAIGYASQGTAAWSADLAAGVLLIALGCRALAS
jgi:hypothetical protein